MRPSPDLSSTPRAQLCSSMKNIDHSEGCLHPHSTCTLRTVNINQYYWDTVTWGTVKSLKLLGFLKNIKAGRDVSSWVSEAFPAPLKTKGDVKKNSCMAPVERVGPACPCNIPRAHYRQLMVNNTVILCSRTCIELNCIKKNKTKKTASTIWFMKK